MKTIPIRVCGDFWFNPDEVAAELDQVAGKDTVVLDLQAEGPGLDCLKVTDMVNNYCSKYGVNPDKILIDHWSNNAEPVPYTVINLPIRSHFFSLSENYWLDRIPKSTHNHVFGYFIGRRSIPRAVIMHHLHHVYGSKILFSCLKTNMDTPWRNTGTGVHLEHLRDWLPVDQHTDFINWWDTNPIPSVDDHFLYDQYCSGSTTNRDLLKYYNQFDIEIVSESYTRGLSFFPTEKTVRPLMSAKPIIVQGPCNYLKNLQAMGFETYNSLWDESYDLFEGVQRWELMKKLIDHIMNMNPVKYSELINQAAVVALRNRNHLAKIIKIDK